MKATFSKNKKIVFIDGVPYEFVRTTFNETRQTWSFVYKKLSLEKETKLVNKEGE